MIRSPHLSNSLSSLSPRRGSLRTQLIVWNIAALALLLGAFGLIIRYTVFSFMMESVDRELDTRISRMPPPPGPPHAREGQRPGPPQRDDGPDGPPLDGEDRPPVLRPEDRRPPRPIRDNSPYRPLYFDRQGQLMDPDATHALWDVSAFPRAIQGNEVRSTLVVGGEPYRVISRPARDQGEIVGVIQAPYPLADVERAISGLDRALLMLIPLGLLGAGLGGATLTNRVLRRVHRMTLAAEQISAHEFAERLPVSGNDEFSELAETFNGLLGRQETVFQQQERVLEQQRRFTADASHELKTPLTIIKGNASMALSGNPSEATYRQLMQEIDGASDTMSHLVKDLLLLARSDSGLLGRNRIELLAREVLGRAVTNVSRGLTAPITLKIADDNLTLSGNESELTRLFTNLLDNAVRYTPAEGQITVTVSRQGDNAIVLIADSGMGIAPEHLAHLGERFYRVDSSRARPSGGTGLGLSICKGIVEAYGGMLTIDSEAGIGTTVRVMLPCSL